MTRTLPLVLSLILLAACERNNPVSDAANTVNDANKMVKAIDRANEMRPMLNVYAETLALFQSCRRGDVLARYDEAFAKRSAQVAAVRAEYAARRTAERSKKCDDEKRKEIDTVINILSAP